MLAIISYIRNSIWRSKKKYKNSNISNDIAFAKLNTTTHQSVNRIYQTNKLNCF